MVQQNVCLARKLGLATADVHVLKVNKSTLRGFTSNVEPGNTNQSLTTTFPLWLTILFLKQ